MIDEGVITNQQSWLAGGTVKPSDTIFAHDDETSNLVVLRGILQALQNGHQVRSRRTPVSGGSCSGSIDI